MDASFILRPAAASDIDELIAIDDDACTLYDEVGLHFDFTADHPFARDEHARWATAARDGHALLVGRPHERPAGMLVMGFVDAAPHLEQLSVRRGAMRRGIGRRLLAHAIEWAADRPLWLTTYAHLPWNRPFYESAGFAVVLQSACPPSIVQILDEQRRWLPAPAERIAMRRDPR
jgi:GNAT superfamily N-acetyltransferase